MVYDYAGKVNRIIKGYWNRKRKLGVYLETNPKYFKIQNNVWRFFFVFFFFFDKLKIYYL